MAAIKATRTEVVTVCHCGATTTYEYDELIVGFTEVVLPECPVCSLCRITLAAVAASDSWVGASDELLQRYLLGQVIHYRTLKSEASCLSNQTKDLIRLNSQKERLHEFVDDSIEVYVAPLPQVVETARQFYELSGSCFPLLYEGEPQKVSTSVSASIRSRLFK